MNMSAKKEMLLNIRGLESADLMQEIDVPLWCYYYYYYHYY